MPLESWAEAVSTAVYIRNRCPTAALDNKTPHQCWFDEKPDLTSLRVFGSLCYVLVPNDQRQKLDAKSYKAIFVGYPDGTKGYKVFNISNGKFYRTRDVLFNENDFHTFDNTAAPGKKEVSNIVLPDISDMYYDDSGEIVHDDENVDGGVAIPAHIVDNDTTDDDVTEEPAVRAPLVRVPNNPFPSEAPVATTPQPSLNSGVQAAAKTIHPTYEQTFMEEVQNIGNARIRNPPKRFDDECHYTESLLDDIEEPKSFKAACTDQYCEQWGNAMKDEYNSLIKNKTWDLVPRPKDKNYCG